MVDPLTDRLCVASSDHWTQPTLTVRFFPFSAATPNTFPVPELDEKSREKIIKAGHGVLAAREFYPDRSLADHYNPLAMDPALVKAHDVLDREVDKAFGSPRKLTTERQRQELLFTSYARMTSAI